MVKRVWADVTKGETPKRLDLFTSSRPDELLVRDPVRAVGLGAEALVAVLLVGLEVALEPDDLRVTLEGEHGRFDAVQEPAVVGDHYGAAGERQQRLLEH